MARENNKFINLIDDIMMNESRLKIKPEMHHTHLFTKKGEFKSEIARDLYEDDLKFNFAKTYQLNSKAEVKFETKDNYQNGSKICLGDIIKIQDKNGDKLYMVKFDEKRELIKEYAYDNFVKDISPLLGEDEKCYLQDEQQNKREFFTAEALLLVDKNYQPNIEKIGNIYEQTLRYNEALDDKYNFNELTKKFTKELDLQVENEFTGDLSIKHGNLDIRYDFYNAKQMNIYHDELQSFIDLCKSNKTIQKFKDDPISKNIEISHETKMSHFPSFSVKLNEFIEIAMRDDIQTKEQLHEVVNRMRIDKFYEAVENVDKIYLGIDKDIRDYEKKFSILLPEAKERKIKEILVNIDKIKKQNAHYRTQGTQVGMELYNSKMDKFLQENQKVIDNIENFKAKYQAQSKANTR